ncbi:MAG: pyocin activator PrtN family protein [Ectothiorhodospiraceae bacterium]|nr:pyocin activator PrtN family protein [Chromatiales bacterium]MCP5156697.1 pyocin activator PrtN family protein [Ectothiorhodospiraceae bacterium]
MESTGAPTTAELLIRQFAPAVLLTLKQVSLVTGQAEQTLRNLISQGRTTLPTRKVGGKRVVHVLDLAAWLDAQPVAAVEPPHPPVRRRPGRPTKLEQRRGR